MSLQHIILKSILEKKIESSKQDILKRAGDAHDLGVVHGAKGKYDSKDIPDELGAFYDAGVQDSIDKVSKEQQEELENPPVLEKYNKRKQKCKQTDGDSGNYVLSYTDKKGKKRRACHTSKKKMQGQIAAIEMEADTQNLPIVSELTLKRVIYCIINEKHSAGYRQKYGNEELSMRISKRQLRRIIKEEKARILREQETASQNTVDSREHHWPSADGPIGDVVDELAASWEDMEISAWSAGDPSMNMQGELSDTESKEWWTEQVTSATPELEETLRERLRATAIEVMKEYTDKLINGDFS